MVVTVNSVKERVLPTVDDEFAAEASAFDTVEEMRADLVEKVRQAKNQTQGAQARDRVLDALLEAADIPVPEAVVQAEIDNREHSVVHALGHDDAAFEAWLQEQGQTREEFLAELRGGAEQSVRSQLLLDALAERAQVGVTQEEFTERVLFNAQRAGVSPDEDFKQVQEGNQLTAIFAEVRRAKALAGAVPAATVTDQSGNVLDVQALFGFVPVSDEDEDAIGQVGSAAEVSDDSEVATATADSAESADSIDSAAGPVGLPATGPDEKAQAAAGSADPAAVEVASEEVAKV